MNLDKLISRATHTTGRSLLAVASVVVLADMYDFNLTGLPIIATAKEMSLPMVAFGTFVLILFLLVTHFLNWMNDYLAFQASFQLSVVKDKQDSSTNYIETSGDVRDTEAVWKEEVKPIKDSNIAQRISLFGQHLAVPALIAAYALYVLIPKVWPTGAT